MKLIFATCAVLFAFGAHAIERKPLAEVDINALAVETQRVTSTNESIDFAWWITPEFWEATFRQNPNVPEAQVEQILGILGDDFVLAVVQADISPFGDFRFFDKKTVMDALKVEVVRADGSVLEVSHTEPSNPDLRIMLDQLRPILAQAMGNLGENFYFFPLAMSDADGDQILSAHAAGQLRVSLKRGETTTVFEIETPLDSLFVPRTCPNGKRAHVSWTYCPWSGEKLTK